MVARAPITVLQHLPATAACCRLPPAMDRNHGGTKVAGRDRLNKARPGVRRLHGDRRRSQKLGARYGVALRQRQQTGQSPRRGERCCRRACLRHQPMAGPHWQTRHPPPAQSRLITIWPRTRRWKQTACPNSGKITRLSAHDKIQQADLGHARPRPWSDISIDPAARTMYERALLTALVCADGRHRHHCRRSISLLLSDLNPAHSSDSFAIR